MIFIIYQPFVLLHTIYYRKLPANFAVSGRTLLPPTINRDWKYNKTHAFTKVILKSAASRLVLLLLLSIACRIAFSCLIIRFQ